MRQKAERLAALFFNRRGLGRNDRTAPSDSEGQAPERERKVKRKSGAPRLPRSKSAPGGQDFNYDSEYEDEELFEVVKETAWDGIKYLGSERRSTRLMWMTIIIAFVLLSLFQIHQQVQQYMSDPVATNIDVEYPQKIAFPVVAICNNNQYRLSYMTELHKASKSTRHIMRNQNLQSVNAKSRNPFDQVITANANKSSADFLQQASHQLEDLLMRCVLPDGSACNASDFKPFWTMDGLCWAFNTDMHKPLEVAGSGNSYGLRLLLNLESYERIESDHKYFKSRALPGLKILIFNQTDIPHSTSDGLNVPGGFTSYLPISMQQLSKLPRSGCQEEPDESKEAFESDFFSKQNIRSCKFRKYLGQIEHDCKCSMAGLFKEFFGNTASPIHTRNESRPCTVDEYFACVSPTIKKVRESGASNKCLPSCESFEYSAWQDLNRLPRNLLPLEKEEEISQEELHRLRRFTSTTTTTTSKAAEEVDSEYVESDEAQKIDYVSISEPITCEASDRIKKRASDAYEAQYKYQEDIADKYKMLIKNLRNARLRLFAAGWGWHNDVYTGAYKRFTDKHPCVKRIENNYKDIILYLILPANRDEKKRAELLLSIVDPATHAKTPNKFNSIGEVKKAYGNSTEKHRMEIIQIVRMTKEMWSAFYDANYSPAIVADLTEMDRIIDKAEGMEDFAGLKKWADDMHSADRIFFVKEEFNEGWYKAIYKDLDKNLVKTFKDVFDNQWPKHKNFIAKGDSYLRTASILFFSGQQSKENITKVSDFYNEMEQCMKEVNTTAVQMLNEYKTLYKKFQSAYHALFTKELGKVQEKFEFNDDFERENFAMVYIYINRMVVEKWAQEETYSVWSLASDIGGSLGLFLGASLVSIIEIIYIAFHFGVSKQVTKKVEEHRKRSTMPMSAMSSQTRQNVSVDPTARVSIDPYLP